MTNADEPVNTEPVPSLTDLMDERRALWKQMREAIEGNARLRPNHENAITIAFFETNLAIDELLAARLISTCEAQKWISGQLGELKAHVEDLRMADAEDVHGGVPVQ